MTNPLQTLVAVVGPHDPFTPGLVSDGEVIGPILATAQRQALANILLFAADAFAARAQDTVDALKERVPGAAIKVVPLPATEVEGAEVLCRHLYGNSNGPFCIVAAGDDISGRLRRLVEQGAVRGSIVEPDAPLYAGDEGISASLVPPSAGNLIVREPRVQYGHRSPVAVASDEPEARVDEIARKLGIRGEHPALRIALQTSAALAGHRVPVLIEGETGTGKSLIAKLVHALSGRADGSLVSVNCGALPEKLVESTLFGHRKGAFTGANADHAGKFEAADGGTLFLDEVGELPLELQPKLLKVLEDGVVEPVGATKGFTVDVRVIAATNRDLKAMVAERAFREDLYYRLSFGLIRLPPLRERRSDIGHLALNALSRINRSLRLPKRLSPAAIERLEKQEWRGNVRDLENVIGRSALLVRGDVLDADDLLIDEPVRADDPFDALPVPNESFSLESFLSSARKQLILRALEIAGGSQSGAARLLGISPQAVHKFLNAG